MNTYNHDPELKRINDLLRKYASDAGVNIDVEQIAEPDGLKLFSLIVNDFYKGIVSVDDLSFFCEMMEGKFDFVTTNLGGLLTSGMEIEWDIRHKPISAANSIDNLLHKFVEEYKR